MLNPQIHIQKDNHILIKISQISSDFLLCIGFPCMLKSFFKMTRIERKKHVYSYTFRCQQVKHTCICFLLSICALKAIINTCITLFSWCLPHHIITTLKRSAFTCILLVRTCVAIIAFSQEIKLLVRRRKDKNYFRYCL